MMEKPTALTAKSVFLHTYREREVSVIMFELRSLALFFTRGY